MTDLAFRIIKATGDGSVVDHHGAPADPAALDGRWIDFDIDRGVVRARYRGDPAAVENLAWTIPGNPGKDGVAPVEVGVYRASVGYTTETATVQKDDLLMSYKLTPSAFGRVASGAMSPADALRRVVPNPQQKEA